MSSSHGFGGTEQQAFHTAVTVMSVTLCVPKFGAGQPEAGPYVIIFPDE